jgi:hypothetical protein
MPEPVPERLNPFPPESESDAQFPRGRAHRLVPAPNPEPVQMRRSQDMHIHEPQPQVEKAVTVTF